MKIRSFYLWSLLLITPPLAGSGCSDGPDDKPVNPEIKIEAGQSAPTSVSFTLSASDADQMAYLIAQSDGIAPVSTAEAAFTVGKVIDGSAATPITVDELMSETAYTIYAAARSGERYSELRTLEVTTIERPAMLSFVSSTKTGFTYRVEGIADDETFFHMYLEKWAYDDLCEQYQEQMGEDFDKNLMLQNTLADYGLEATGPQDITWQAGDENPLRGGSATIVGGKDYYAIVSRVDPEAGVWVGNAEEIAFKTEPAGASSAMIDIVIEQLTTEQVVTRIDPDPSIRFFFYHLFRKAVVDAYIEQFGQESFENYIYENGYAAEESYTDRWAFSVPGESYVLAVLAVDKEGNTLYADQVIDSPAYVPEVAIQLQPYENELQGYYDYQSLEATVATAYFGETPTEPMMWNLLTKEALDASLEMAGTQSIEEAVTTGFIYLNPGLAEEWSEQLQKDGGFIARFNDLEPETEYYFITMVEGPGGDYIVSYGSAATKAKPADTQPDAGYLAFLGSWKLSGQSTEYWSKEHMIDYDLTVEQLTPNRSYLVRGWSKSAVGQQHPFVMNYDPATKKAFIRAPQSLGTYTDAAVSKDYEVVFTGLFIYGMTDDLSLLYGPTYTAYQCSINGNSMSMIPSLFTYGDRDYSFASMGYSGRTPDGLFHRLTGDEYDPVYFTVVRGTAAGSAARSAAPAGLGAKRSAVLLRPAAPQVRVPLRPAVQPAAVPAFARRISPAFAERMAMNPGSVAKWRRAQPLQTVPRMEPR